MYELVRYITLANNREEEPSFQSIGSAFERRQDAGWEPGRVTTFGTYVRWVHEPSLPLIRRRQALRGCVAAFHPYGFEATWRKVTSGRRIATHQHGTTHVPDLLAAVDELEVARRFWLLACARYAERRRGEKAAGIRTPRAADQWPDPIAYCPDPSVYPTEPVVEVLARVIGARAAGRRGCPNCGGQDTLERPYKVSGYRCRTCTTCGIRC